jgi:hypothetical protein
MRALVFLARLPQHRHLRFWLMVVVMIGLIGTVSVPVRMPDLINQREGSGRVVLQMLSISQKEFAASCGNGGYARTIEKLAAPPSGSSDGFLDGAMVTQASRHYVITLTGSGTSGPLDCFGEPTVRSYSATAVPLVLGESGRRSFTLKPDGTISSTESR